MLIPELRDMVKDYSEENLRLLVVELYRAMPKALREDKDIDTLIRQARERSNGKITVKTQKEEVDVWDLQLDIESFLEDAYAQNYFAPNRVISKAERPKWRFKTKGYIKSLQSVPMKGEEGKIAAELLEKLYLMMCYGCCYYIFSSTDTFRSVGIKQIELLDIAIRKKFENGIDREAVKSAVTMVVAEGLDSETVQSELFAVLMANLKTVDAKELTLLEAMGQKTEMDKKEANAPKKKYYGSGFGDFKTIEKNNHLTELVFLLNIALCKYEEGIHYFTDNYKEANGEISLYVVLRYLFELDLEEYWVTTYEEAVKNGIKPRENLQRVHQYIAENGELPKSFY